MHLRKMILKKRKNYIEQELTKNRSKLKDLRKALNTLGLILNKEGTNQFEALENANTFKRFFSESAQGLQQNCQRHPKNLQAKQPKTTTPRLLATYPLIFKCQTYLERLLKKVCLVLIPVKPLE